MAQEGGASGCWSPRSPVLWAGGHGGKRAASEESMKPCLQALYEKAAVSALRTSPQSCPSALLSPLTQRVPLGKSVAPPIGEAYVALQGLCLWQGGRGGRPPSWETAMLAIWEALEGEIEVGTGTPEPPLAAWRTARAGLFLE